MENIFTQSSFFTLAALFKADNIFGVTFAQLPDSVAARQAIYNEGEQILIREGLLEISANTATLQPDLLRQMQTLTQPQTALLVVRSVPAYGNQMFYYYGRDKQYVEHTQPDAQHHRLGDVGNLQNLCQRLQEIFSLVDCPPPTDSGILVSAPLMLATFQLALRNGIADARDALADNAALNSSTEQWLNCIGNLALSGSIAIAKIVEGQDNATRDLAIFSGAGQNWLLADLGDGSARLGQIDPISFGRLLSELLQLF